MVLVSLKYAIKDKTTAGEVAVVVDILRASTTITTSLYYGAEWIISTTDTKTAFELAEKYNAMLIGERNCLKINGFDLGNSPAEMIKEKVNGKKIVFTSTNFSKALASSMKSPIVLIGSMLNISAVTKFTYALAKEKGCDICFMLAGNADNNADEDLAFAGVSGSILKDFCDCCIGDDVKAAIDFVNAKGAEECIKDSNHAMRLINSGFFDDLEFACRKDIFDIVPILKNNKIYKMKQE